MNRIAASLADQTSDSGSSPAESSFGTVIPNPPGDEHYGLGQTSTGFCPSSELSRGTAGTSNDLSLLGPGETTFRIPSSSTVIAPMGKSRGLSLSNNVAQVLNLETKLHGSLLESSNPSSPPKSKRPRTEPPAPVSIHEESSFSNHNSGASLDVERRPAIQAAEEDNQKLWSCVCDEGHKRIDGLKFHRAHLAPCNNALCLGEAMAVSAEQHRRVSNIESGVSLIPSFDESMSSGTNTSAQPVRLDSSKQDIRTLSSSDAYTAGTLRDCILPENGPPQTSDAGLYYRGEAEGKLSKSAASASFLPPTGLFNPPLSSFTSVPSVSNVLTTSLSDGDQKSVEGKQITHSELSSANPDLQKSRQILHSEEAEVVSDSLSSEGVEVLPSTLRSKSMEKTTMQLSSAGGDYTECENLEGQNTKGESLAEGCAITNSVSSRANLQALPSQLRLLHAERITASNHGIKTSTEVLHHHPKALAQTPLEDKINRRSQTSRSTILGREPQRSCESDVTIDQMALNLRRRAPVKYFEDPAALHPEIFRSSPTLPADGHTSQARQQHANVHINQSVKKRAGKQHAPQQRTASQLSREVPDSVPELETMDEAGQEVVQELPYFSCDERITGGLWKGRIFDHDMVEGDQDRIIHMDFDEPEYEELVKAASKTLRLVRSLDAQLPARLRLTEILKNTSKEDQELIRKRARRNAVLLKKRSNDAIDSVLQDASQAQLPETSTMLRLNACPERILFTNPGFFREIGAVTGYNVNISAKSFQRRLQTKLLEGLTTWKTWDDASNDVLVVAWSPGGLTYAVGASAQTDPASAQYNKRNNLLLGDLESNTLRELPDHHIDRPIPEDGGTGNQWAVYNACDPVLQTSVTATRFSLDGDRMYTASYDHTVKVWDVSQRGKPFVVDTFNHDAEVELAATSSFFSGCLATGSRTRENSIRVYYTPESDDAQGAAYEYEVLSSSRAKKHSNEELNPSSLQWGTTWETQNFLLAGFSPSFKDDTGAWGSNGEICLWDLVKIQAVKLIPSSQNVFDAVWHPHLPIFATGSTPLLSNRASHKTRSVVRTYEPLRSSYCTVEYECPALDINDVTFAPHDVNYISAGCTDGITYFWDYRMPDKVMLRLRHGEPLAESHPHLTREQHDTGIRFTAWDQDGHYLYTGSSDGFIKQWDIRRAPENALVRDVTQLKGGVMCGAFSPDYTNLLVGDDTGAIQILSTAPTGQRRYMEEDGYEEGDLIAERIPFIYAPQNQRSTTFLDAPEIDEEDVACYGTMIADDALTTGELSLHPVFGAGKGPNYSGPYCLEARPEGTTENNAKRVALLPKEQAQQLDRHQRKMARKRGWKATVTEQELIKEQVKLAWLRNVNVELSDRWGEDFVKEKDETLVKQFKEGKDIVQMLKELKLQHSGGRDASVEDLLKDLLKEETTKHAKPDEDSDQDVIVRKKSKHRHSKVLTGSDDDLIHRPSTNLAKPRQYREVGDLIIIDSDSEEEEANATKSPHNPIILDSDPSTDASAIEKHYDPRDAWLPRERTHILFSDAEESWFPSREAERDQTLSEAAIAQSERLRDQERKRQHDASAAEDRRRLAEERQALLEERREMMEEERREEEDRARRVAGGRRAGGQRSAGGGRRG